MAQNWAYHEEFGKDVTDDKILYEGSLQFHAKDDVFEAQHWDVSRIHLQIYADSTNTIQYMKEMAERYADQQE